jgi:hypothetical protein
LIINEVFVDHLQPVVVGDTDSIAAGEESIFLSLDKLLEAFGAGLLHSLEAHLQVDWEFLARLLVSLDDIEPAYVTMTMSVG